MLKVGEKAVDFALSTIGANGPEKIKLSEKVGSKNIVILFVPMAFTSVCTEELCGVSNELASYADLNAEVLAISGDNPFAQAEWAKKEGIKFPLLSDYEHDVATAYGIAYDSFLPQLNLGQKGVPKRSAFVIDKGGVVRYAECNDDPGKLPDFAAIKKVLADLG